MKEINDLTFKVISMGCKVNYYETESISRSLLTLGLKRVNDNEVSDISIINTCTVTEEASRKTKQMIRRAIKITNPDGVVVASGCLAQIDDSLKDIEGLNIVIGTPNKDEIILLIKKYLINKKQILIHNDDIFHSKYESLTVDKFDAHTRAFLKVEDGCTNFCSYCIIPYARGNVRSKPLNVVINEAKELVSNGHKEIVVTGIDTGSYGRDISLTFYDLLKELDKIEGLKRIRISSLEISQLSDEIIELIKKSKKIVHHIHIPIQNGSNRILKLMNRHYDKDYFINKVEKIREEIKGIAITTDYIVGFPTENDEDFKEEIETLEKIKFETIHTFPYSLRKGTKAALIEEQVPPNIKKERSKQVLTISKKYHLEYINKNIGSIEEVLFETYKDGYIYGHTGNYIYVKAKGNIENLNKLYKVKLISLDNETVLSQIIEE